MKLTYCLGLMCLLSVCLNIALAGSDYTITQGSPVALHKEAKVQSETMTLLDPGMHVTLVNPTRTAGFVLVNTDNQENGWIDPERIGQVIQIKTEEHAQAFPSVLEWLKSTLGLTEPNALATPPTGQRDQIISQYSQLQGAYLQLQAQRQQSTLILGVVTLLIGILIGLKINKYRYNRNRW